MLRKVIKLKGLKKGKKEEEEREEEELIEEGEEEGEEVEEEILEEKEPAERVEGGREEDVTTKIMERINEIENRLPRIDVALENTKKEIDEIKSKLQKMDDTMKDVLSLYEVVSSQINPFVSSSGVVDIVDLKRRVDTLEQDFKLIINVDLDRIIGEVLYEEEVV